MMGLEHQSPHPLQVVSDLQWVLHSPFLCTPPQSLGTLPRPMKPAEQEAYRQRLIACFDAGHTARVGHYFEQLVHFMVRDVCRLSVTHYRHRIVEAGRTLGEIDLLFEDEQQQRVHWEIAVKFYLAIPGDGSEPAQFIGPGARDTLDRKLTRLYSHQLSLSLGRFDVSRREAFWKGLLFYHPDQTEPIALPERVDASHGRGVWIRAHETERLRTLFGSARFMRMHKPHWLAPPLGGPTSRAILDSDGVQASLRHHFQHDGRAVMLSVGRHEAARWQEVARLCVVPDRWPQPSR